jgi:hypothetical protein
MLLTYVYNVTYILFDPKHMIHIQNYGKMLVRCRVARKYDSLHCSNKYT